MLLAFLKTQYPVKNIYLSLSIIKLDPFTLVKNKPLSSNRIRIAHPPTSKFDIVVEMMPGAGDLPFAQALKEGVSKSHKLDGSLDCLCSFSNILAGDLMGGE